MSILKTLTINGVTYQVTSTVATSSVTLLASAWKGSGNRYSQTAAILGVSENTQVDLTPSEEQLAIFYDKSLAFVAENEAGLVTVYAIGQKPSNDYTMQVTLTEVAASDKIIGVTVGTPTSPAKMEKEINPVKTVNGVGPDENGNVEVDGGASTLIVTVAGGKASHTSEQIYYHLQNGGNVVLDYYWAYIPLVAATDQIAEFSYVADDYFVYHYAIVGGQFYEQNDQLALSGDVQKKIDNALANLPSGGASTLIVTATEDNIASHTPQEIYDYVQNGGTAVFRAGASNYYQLSYVIPSFASFYYIDDVLNITFVFIEADMPIGKSVKRLVPENAVQGMVDDAISKLPVYDGDYSDVADEYDGTITVE